jgi:wyosine [tRNA(Phe)-imidazoG37] synthetase (radical SAM superfamily)
MIVSIVSLARRRTRPLIIPSLDAGHGRMFEWVNRPHESIEYEQMLEGLIEMREEFCGEYWLEVVVLAGYTGHISEISTIVDRVQRIKPDRVQLNTATRPPAEEYAVMVNKKRMEELAAQFTPPAEVIADYRGVHAQSEFVAGQNSILEMLQRRPCSLEDIVEGLGMHRNEVIKYIEELDDKHLIEKQTIGERQFYKGIHT